jgi:hypothetical protein
LKKVLVRVERAVIRVLVTPSLRPAEHDAALWVARQVAKRVGASAAIVAVAVELINRYVS